MPNDPMDFADRFLLGAAQTALSASLLAFVVWLVCKALPQLPHPVRAALWWLVCARFVAGIACAAVLPPAPALIVLVPPFWQARATNSGVAENGANTIPTDLVPANALPSKSETAVAPSDLSAKPDALSVSPPTLPAPTLPQALCVLWLAGFTVRVLISAAQYARLRRRLRASQPLTGDEADAAAQTLQSATNDAARLMRRPTAPRLLLSQEPGDPLVTGWRCPAIRISRADVARLSLDELRLVLCHEIAHIARRDLFWGLVPHLALHLFWFWPVAYFACREWGLVCEADCDARAARATNTAPRVYGELLLKLGVTAPGASFAALPVSVHFHSLRRRLVLLEKMSPVSRERRLAGALGAGALVLAAVPLALLPLRFSAVASDSAPYSRINGDTGKAWETYPDAPRNLTFAGGLTNWQIPAEDKGYGYTVAVQTVKAPSKGPSLLFKGPKREDLRGVVVQYARPGAFRGKRVRFSGWIKTENSDGAGLFLRLDAPTWQKAWNQVADPLTGANDWQKVSYVFDVPSDAQGFSFGAHLSGAGKVWLHDLTFDVVDAKVAATPAYFDSSPEAKMKNGDTDKPWAEYPAAPTNLQFANGVANWHQGKEDKSDGYVISAQTVPAPTPGASGVLQASASLYNGFGILAQYAQPGDLKSKRVRFSAWVKTEAVKNGAGLWLRMDTPNWQKAWNMTAAPITGTTNWVKWDYVFDVPSDANGFAFGTDLSGKGKVWLHDVSFMPVDAATPVSQPSYDSSPDAKSAKTTDDPSEALAYETALVQWLKANENNAWGINATRIDKSAGRNTGPSNPDRNAELLESTSAQPQRFGTLFYDDQKSLVESNRLGRRVRYTVPLRTENAQGAGIWFVVFSGERVVGFGRTSRPINGTTKWNKYDVILDLPQDATRLVYGLSMNGTGKIWSDGMDITAIGDIPQTQATPTVTAAGARNPISGVDWSGSPTKPENLHFADGLTGWMKGAPSSNAPDYMIGVDPAAARPGGSDTPAYIRAQTNAPKGYGALMQAFQATEYKSKRVRFSGYIKTENVNDARLWIRMDARAKVSAWNMGKRFLQGTNNWTRIEYVFDVPNDAEGFNYGVSVDGQGTVWADGFQFETVTSDVPVTPEPGG